MVIFFTITNKFLMSCVEFINFDIFYKKFEDSNLKD